MSNKNVIPSKNIEITVRYDTSDDTREEKTFNADVLMMVTATLDSNDELDNGDFALLGNTKSSHVLLMLDALQHNVLQAIRGDKHEQQ